MDFYSLTHCKARALCHPKPLRDVVHDRHAVLVRYDFVARVRRVEADVGRESVFETPLAESVSDELRSLSRPLGTVLGEQLPLHAGFVAKLFNIFHGRIRVLDVRRVDIYRVGMLTPQRGPLVHSFSAMLLLCAVDTGLKDRTYGTRVGCRASSAPPEAVTKLPSNSQPGNPRRASSRAARAGLALSEISLRMAISSLAESQP